MNTRLIDTTLHMWRYSREIREEHQAMRGLTFHLGVGVIAVPTSNYEFARILILDGTTNINEVFPNVEVVFLPRGHSIDPEYLPKNPLIHYI